MAGATLVASGVLYLIDANDYGWFGIVCGAALVVLAAIGLLRRDWALTVFGGLFTLALGALVAGIASSSDLYIVGGVLALVLLGCGAALTQPRRPLITTSTSTQEPSPLRDKGRSSAPCSSAPIGGSNSVPGPGRRFSEALTTLHVGCTDAAAVDVAPGVAEGVVPVIVSVGATVAVSVMTSDRV